MYVEDAEGMAEAEGHGRREQAVAREAEKGAGELLDERGVLLSFVGCAHITQKD